MESLGRDDISPFMQVYLVLARSLYYLMQHKLWGAFLIICYIVLIDIVFILKNQKKICKVPTFLLKKISVLNFSPFCRFLHGSRLNDGSTGTVGQRLPDGQLFHGSRPRRRTPPSPAFVTPAARTVTISGRCVMFGLSLLLLLLG